MKDWIGKLSRRGAVSRINASLSQALAQCPTLEASGWNFCCSQCHVGDGSYTVGDTVPWHSHQEYQIEIVVAGVFEFETGLGERISLRPGRALIIPWKFAHRWTCLQRGAMVGISLELHPSPESIRQDGWLIEGVRKVAYSPIESKVDELLTSALDTVHRAYHAKVVACRLYLLLAEVMEQLIPVEEAKNQDLPHKLASETRARETTARIIQHLKENFGADFNLNRVAAEFGLSSRHLHRLFLKHVGKSLHDYLLEYRLEQARSMLSEQGRKALVKEIAFACGFRSLAYFSNSFRRVFGVSPSAILSEKVALKSRYTVAVHAHAEAGPGPPAKAKGKAATATKKNRP